MSIPNPAVNDVLKMTVVSFHTPSSQQGQNTCYYQVTAVLGGGLTVQQIASTFLTSLTGAWRTPNASNVLLGGVIADYMVTATGKVQQSAIARDGATVGLNGATIAPSQSAPVVKKLTGLAGRSKRGRCYFPFLPLAYIDANGELTNAGVTALQSWYSSWIDTQVLAVGAVQTTMVPVLTHKSAPLVPIPITATQVTGKVGTQKRRGDYGRANAEL